MSQASWIVVGALGPFILSGLGLIGWIARILITLEMRVRSIERRLGV